MAADRDRFSTATRLRAFGTALVQGPAARVYRARTRRVRTPVYHGRLTGRAALLALIVCSLVVALAYPMRQYVSQRAEIAEQRREADQARQEVRRLREQKARWRDPAFVERQARERLYFVRPGEIGYLLVGGRDDTRRRPDRAAADRVWYQNLWREVDSADQAR